MSKARNIASTPYIPQATVTAKGDLIVATASSAVTNQAVGANYQTVVADSTQTGGIRWGDDLAVATIMGVYL